MIKLNPNAKISELESRNKVKKDSTKVKTQEDEKQIKRRASNAGFTVIGSNWYLQENPNYKIEKVMNTGLWQTEKAIRYIFKLKLKL